jgi:Tol biopolymer transport system component
LTSDPGYESGPYYSPNGRQIAFSRETDKCGHIWVISTDGTQEKQLTSGPDYDSNPLFTPDGSHMVYYSNSDFSAPNRSQIWRIHADGSGKQFVVNGEHPGCSPNDKEIAYVVDNRELWELASDASSQKAIYRSNSVKEFVALADESRCLCFLEETNEGIFLSNVLRDGSDYRRLERCDIK